jgi:methyl-accepting chemotaxis protein
MATNSYVKFNRGSQAAYTALKTKDSNSLYFISETDSKNGILYLGDKIISALPDGKILSNNANGELTLANFGTSYIDTSGATVNNSFKEGLQPKVIKDGNDYKIAWYEPSSTTIEDVSSQIGTINGNIESINNNISTLSAGVAENAAAITGINSSIQTLKETEIPNLINQAIADETLLSYKIVTTTDEIETLELSNKERYIFLVPGEGENNDNYEEWMYLKTTPAEGGDPVYTLEKVGDWEVDLSDYVTNATYTSTIDNINANIASLQAATADLGTIRTDIISLQTATADLGTIRTNIETLQTATADLGTIRTNIETLQTTTGNNSSAITDLQANMANVLGAITWEQMEDPETPSTEQ